ncbi:MAG: hypothetical protein QXF76_04040 [Candidatus Anstonellales archaeon]
METEKTKRKKKSDVYENIEYIAVYKNKKQIELIEGNDINGKTKTELQKYLGNKYGAGTYSLSIKKFGDNKNIVSNLTGIVTERKENQLQDDRIELLLQKIENLANLSSKNNVIDFTTLLQMKDETYKIQIEFYRERIKQLENELEKLRNEFENDNQPDLLQTLLPLLIKQQQQ